MSDRLQVAWRYANKEIWNPLFRRFAHEHPDLPIEVVRVLLVRPAGTKQIFVAPGREPSLDQRRADEATYLDSVADARLALRRIRPEFFIDGRSVAHALTEISGSLLEFNNPDLAAHYEGQLARFINRHALPYRLRTAPVRLIPLLPGELDGLYMSLCARAGQQPGLQEALDAFEEAWQVQAREWTQINGKHAIRTASLLAENMILSAANGEENEFSRALGRFRRSGRFPSNDFVNIFERAYTFANTYPNIRHAGNPNAQLRELRPEDVLLSALVFVGLSSCIHALCENG